jgi:hypothetical protein
VLDLLLEKRHPMRLDEISRRVGSRLTHTVVDQRNASSPGCSSSGPLDNRRQRGTEGAKEDMGDALQQETDFHRGVHMYANGCSTVSRPLAFGERRQ